MKYSEECGGDIFSLVICIFASSSHLAAAASFRSREGANVSANVILWKGNESMHKLDVMRYRYFEIDRGCISPYALVICTRST